MIGPVLALAALGFAIAFPLSWLLLRLGRRLGALDTHGAEGHIKDLRPVPNIGGVAIFAAVALPLATGLFALLFAADFVTAALPAVEAHLPRVRETGPTVIALLLGMTLLHVIGLIDDRRGLGPWAKLSAQFLIAAAMALFFDVRLLTALDTWLGIGPAPSIALTILWIVLIANAINFIDNMDGLAGGVCLIAAGLFLIATLLNGQWFIAAALALLVGGLLGFLPFNLPPARLFMGDGGSLPLGFLLAVLTARTTYYNPADPAYALGAGWYGVFMPVIVLAIPLYDFFSVTFIRLRQGRSPFVGDQQHFSHRLVQRGLTKRGAVMVIWAATAVAGIGGISLGHLQPWQAILVGVQTLLVLGMLALIEHASRHAAEGSRRGAQDNG